LDQSLNREKRTALQRQAFWPVVCGLLCLVMLPGCTTEEVGSAGERRAGKTVLIGLIPEQNLFRQIERYEPLAGYLSERTGLHIRLTILPRYGNIIDHFVQEKMDGAFFGSFTYALAHARLGVQVAARPEGHDGRSSYCGYIFVRKDSAIRTAGHMRGKRFAFVDRATTAGYLLPLAYFRRHQFKYHYLREVYYSGTHEDTIYDVLNGKADIGAAKNTVFDRLAATDARIHRDLIVLETSPAVPENALAFRHDLDEADKRAITQALLNMQNDEQGIAVLNDFGARRFIPTRDDDYEPVNRYARQVGLDLTTYNYRNQ
jgi:phosphonate transport system substrate-binding protein